MTALLYIIVAVTALVFCVIIVTTHARAEDEDTGIDAPDPRPNIILMLADDRSWPHASVLGDPVVKTPTFDRIVREGVLFANAFVSLAINK